MTHWIQEYLDNLERVDRFYASQVAAVSGKLERLKSAFTVKAVIIQHLSLL